MKKIIGAILGIVLTTSLFAAVNCVKNENCAKDQLKQITKSDSGISNSISFSRAISLVVINNSGHKIQLLANFDRRCWAIPKDLNKEKVDISNHGSSKYWTKVDYGVTGSSKCSSTTHYVNFKILEYDNNTSKVLYHFMFHSDDSPDDADWKLLNIVDKTNDKHYKTIKPKYTTEKGKEKRIGVRVEGFSDTPPVDTTLILNEDGSINWNYSRT